MRLVFLGTGGAGNPPIGVDARAADLAPRGTNALVVQPNYPDPPTLLVDAGPDLRAQWAAWEDAPAQPDAVLLSHSHFDHIGGMGEFRRCVAPVSVYGTAPTLARLAHLGAIVQRKDPSLNLTPHELAECGRALIDGVTVEIVPLHHGDEPLIGFILRHGGKTMAHLTDTGPIVERAVRATICSCDVLVVNTPFMHDAPLSGIHPSLADGHERHLSIPQAITLAREVGAKRLVLLHFLHTVSERTLRDVAATYPWVVIPRDGEHLDV